MAGDYTKKTVADTDLCEVITPEINICMCNMTLTDSASFTLVTFVVISLTVPEILMRLVCQALCSIWRPVSSETCS
jgi:hypothetical protein